MKFFWNFPFLSLHPHNTFIFRYIPESAICFPTDAWCPSYVPPTPDDYSANYADDPEYEAVDYTDYQTVEQPKMSDRTCDPSLEPQVPFLHDPITIPAPRFPTSRAW